MTKKSILVVVSVVISSVLALCIIDPRVPIFFLGSMDEGSPRFAERWRERFAAIDTPDEITRQYPGETGTVRFQNGEWVVYALTDSHSSFWGGSLVMKDNTGRIRAFFGHVCGDGYMCRFSQVKSLDEFYRDNQWEFFNFHEYTYPD